MDRMGVLNYVAVFREGSERVYEALWFFDRKARDSKNRALPLLSGMSGVQQVVNDFLSLDDGEMSVAHLRARDPTE